MSREMKYSGAAWIGNIPKHWDVGRYKFCGTLEKGKLPSETNIEGKGLPIIGASEMNGKPPRQFTEEILPMCTEQDILILWDGANAGLVAHGMCGIVSSTAVVLKRDTEKLNSDYLYYQLKSNETFFRDKVNGTTIPHMNSAYLDELPPLIPPLVEQKAIADFLDKKCNEIDELVALQEKMIEELKAYKQSVITEAVCKGLNPNVPMKDSGVEWIDITPEHWEVRAIKTMALLKSGDNLTSLDIDENVTLYPVYGGNGVRGYYSQYNHDGDYALIGRQGALCGNVNYGYGRFWATEHCVVCHPKCNYILKWFGESLRAMNLNQYSLSSAQPGISVDRINNVKMLVPPIQEQQEIAEYLDKKCSEIDQLIAIKQQKIVELNDYKKSLIYEYTTGKKEVEL